jgi:hypothetical protein
MYSGIKSVVWRSDTPWSRATLTVVGCRWGPVIPTLARIGSPAPGRFPYSFQIIPRCLLGAWITSNPHRTGLDKPVELHWWTCGDNVIRYDWESNPGSLPRFEPMVTTVPKKSCGEYCLTRNCSVSKRLGNSVQLISTVPGANSMISKHFVAW